MKRILVIAPHPDDEVLGCGGTVAKRVLAGDEAHLCVVTRAYAPDWPEDEITERRKEVLKVNKILGIKKTHFLDMPTVKLDTIPQKTLNEAITRVVDMVKPQTVFLPFSYDVNRDHRIVFDAALVALRPKPDSVTRKILCYETLSETEWAPPFTHTAFVPNVYEDISETLAVKLKAMSVYKSELKEYPHPRSLEAIEARAKIRGSTAGVPAAEAFILIREVLV